MQAELAMTRQQGRTFNPALFAKAAPAGLSVSPAAGNRIADMIDDIPLAHRRLKQGEYLYRAGSEFRYIYVLNAGFAKTCHASADGREQTTGFHLRGDILGLDAVATGTYNCDAIALDVCDVLAIPYDVVIARGMQQPALMRELHCAFSAEIRSDRDLMLRMGSLPAEGRVAAFLLEMSQRFGSRGFSATRLQLRLTRQEIGSLLGLKLETVSRAFSRFAKVGLISVHLRDITLLDVEGLKDMMNITAGHDAELRAAA